MCGKTMVAPIQENDILLDTGTQGFLCRSVYVMEKLEYSAQFLINIKLDRNKDCPVIQYMRNNTGDSKFVDESKMGHIYVDFKKNLSMPQLLGVAGDLGIDSEKSQLTFILKHLYDLFVERDAEII
jgi:succinyl-CoA synthetase beta subunit